MPTPLYKIIDGADPGPKRRKLDFNFMPAGRHGTVIEIIEMPRSNVIG